MAGPDDVFISISRFISFEMEHIEKLCVQIWLLMPLNPNFYSFFFLFNVFYNIGQIEANGFLHQGRGFQKSLAEENTFFFFFFVVVLSGVSCSTHSKHPPQLHTPMLKQQRKLSGQLYGFFYDSS